MTEPLIDAATVAQHLGVPISWVRDATRDGRLPVVRLGRYTRYRLSSVEAWISDREESAPSRRGAYDPRQGQPRR